MVVFKHSGNAHNVWLVLSEHHAPTRSVPTCSPFDVRAQSTSDHATPTPHLFLTEAAVMCFFFWPPIALVCGCTFGSDVRSLAQIKSRLPIVAIGVTVQWCPAECTLTLVVQSIFSEEVLLRLGNS